MKKLVLRKFSSDAIPTEHPDLGGTFNIRPMTFDEALRYAELVTKQDFARDSAGRIVYNRDGSPAMKYAGDPREHIEFAASLLDETTPVENIAFEDGSAFTPTDESMRQLLTLMGTDEIEMEVPADADGKPLDQAKLTPEEIEEHKAGTTTVKKPVRENVYLWVTRKSAFYAGERNKVVKGN
jgi:hypothetical protein